MVLRLALLLFSINIFAQGHHHHCLHNQDGLIDCVSADQHLESGDGGFPQQVLDWWAATKNKVKTAKCQNAGNVSQESMFNYINRHNGSGKSESYFGMSFENEDPHKLDLLRKLTKFDGMWNFKEEENIASQKNFDIPSDCKKVMCAAESIFGKEQAPKLLYLLDRYELNLSHVTDDNITSFSNAQLDTILEAVDDLPAHLIPFERNQYFKHYKHGYGPSSTTLANATITLYDPWDDQDSNEMRMYTVIHEIGHNIGSRLKQDEDPEWLNITGWIELNGEWTSLNNDEQVSKYGATNPAEDFAEAFSGYRYDPEKLKELSPEKYEYMKNNVFLGIEYTSEEKCSDENTSLATLRDVLNSEQPVPNKYSTCSKEISELVIKGNTNLKACIEKAIISAKAADPAAKRSKFEIYAINQALSFETFSGHSVTKKQEEEAYKIILGDVFGSIAQNYYNFGDTCEKASNYAWQNLMDFSDYHFNDKYHKVAQTDDELAPIMNSICESTKAKSTVDCKDLAPIMSEYFPSELGIQIDASKVKQVSGTPNSFRCEIQ